MSASPNAGLPSALALALFGSLVLGQDSPRESRPAPAPAAAEEIDIDKLHRPKRTEPIVDAFAQKAPPAPAPAPVQVAKAEPAPPPPPPAPPALPFRFVGKFVEDGAVRLLIVKGEAEHSISGGETLDGIYRVDEITDQAVTFTYLPLNIQQTLPLAAPNEVAQ